MKESLNCDKNCKKNKKHNYTPNKQKKYDNDNNWIV